MTTSNSRGYSGRTRARGDNRRRWGRAVALWFLAVSAFVVACGGGSESFPDESNGAGETVSKTRQGLTKGTAGSHNGDDDYCNNAANKCAQGEGDCDASSQCVTGLACVNDNGPKFGFAPGSEVCAPAHCGNGVQDAGETGVDCEAGCGSCIVTVCSGTPGAAGFCNGSNCLCSSGQGDCVRDADCQPGLACTRVGIRFGFSANTDVCVPLHCKDGIFNPNDGELDIDCGGACGACFPNCSGAPGGEPFCQGCICQAGQGDCDGDLQCQRGLVCQGNNGSKFNLPYLDDACVAPHCTNGVKDGDETLIDCGGECGACGVTDFDLGATHACDISSNRVRCWGGNGSGQLGDGTLVGHSIATVLTHANLSLPQSLVTAGGSHSCAVSTAGVVTCWGDNHFGQLANPSSNIPAMTPVFAVGAPTGISQIVSGENHVCVRSGGTVSCWGDNSAGQLGTGTAGGIQPSPTAVTGITTAVHISAGFNHTCAALANGTAVCWGSNAFGKLGDNTFPHLADSVSATPRLVTGVANAIQVSTGDNHSCAMRSDGTVFCWGYNVSNTLAIGAEKDGLTPSVVPGAVASLSIASSAAGTCTARSSAGGFVYCWGGGAQGQVGAGSTGLTSPAPYLVLGANRVPLVKGGGNFMCANTTVAPGVLRCWGDDTFGQLGKGTPPQPASQSTPQVVWPPPGAATSVDPGDVSTCAVASDGKVYCWGRNDIGQLGDGTYTQRRVPAQVSGVTGAVSVAVGNVHACAVLSDGSVRCWGDNAAGQLGRATPLASPTSLLVDGITSAVRVETGTSTTCVLKTDGSVACWGRGSEGELGNGLLGSLGNSPTPTTVTVSASANLTSVSALSLGLRHACAIAGGEVYCWGQNDKGQVGSLKPTNQSRAVKVPGLANVTAIATGQLHSCAVVASGAAYCWGGNSDGQLSGTAAESLTPQLVEGIDGQGTNKAKSISAWGSFTCAVLKTGEARCWGQNFRGQLGIGTLANSPTPQAVPGVWTSIAAGGRHTCGLLTSGQIRCWGYNDYGQTGTGKAWLFPEAATAFPPASPSVRDTQCVSDANCSFGQICWQQQGPRFNLPQGSNVCVNAECATSPTPSCGTATDKCGKCDGAPRQCDGTAGSCYFGETCGSANGASLGFASSQRACWTAGCDDPDFRAANCGTVGSACGTCAPGSITCTNNANCPSGQVCGIGAGPRFGHAPGTSVCWDESCPSSCGSLVSNCGLCGDKEPGCQNDAQCAPGLACLIGGGPSFGLPPGTNVCVQKRCTDGTRSASDCGDASDTCGHCSPRTCASDSECLPNETCGATNGTQFGESPATRICWPTSCTDPTYFAAHCGDTTAPCGSCTCVPYCTGKQCGDDPSDGCGTECPGFCGLGEVGCSTDGHCIEGTLCRGRTEGSATFNVCVAEGCLANPQLLGCGSATSLCGPTCATRPECNSTSDCPSGYICGDHNGYRYGKSGANVCELPDCATRPTELGCGDFSAECGLCDCQPQCDDKSCADADLSDGCGGTCPSVCVDRDPAGCDRNLDCQPGSICMQGAGDRVGLPLGTNVCLPAECGETPISRSNCGELTSLCGLCPAAPPGCLDRQCGPDPTVTGGNPNACGTCVGPGQYCSVAGLCNDSPDPRSPVRIPTGSSGNDTREVPPPSAPQAPDGFGAIPGEFSVSERGSANYVIPIQVPPGRAGIEPALSLRYASSGGESTLGLGWNLDGLSSIRRCGSTVAFDGFAAAPTGGREDNFCLDGQRLVGVKTNEATGGMEYKTYPDTFVRVESTLDYGESVQSFTLHAKDGRILVYGGTPDSRGSFDFQNIPSAYLLSEVRDREGNTMRVRYKSTWGSVPLPSSIVYTGSSLAPEGDRGISFNYEDMIGRGGFRMPTGTSSSLTYRMKSIDIRVRGASVRSYLFGYEMSPRLGQPLGPAPARLTSIKECAGAPGQAPCRLPSSFEYSNEALDPFEPAIAFYPPSDSPTNMIGRTWMPYGTPLRGGGPDSLGIINGTVSISPDILGTVAFAAVDLAMTLNPVVGPYYAAATAAAGYFGYGIKPDLTNASIYYTRYYWRYPDKVSQGTLYLNPKLPTEHVIRDSWGPSQDRIVDVFPARIDRPKVLQVHGAPVTVTIATDYYPRMWFADVNGDGIQDRLSCAAPVSNPSAAANLNIKLAVPGHVDDLVGRVPPATATDFDVSIAAPPDVCSIKCAPGAPTITEAQVDGANRVNGRATLFHCPAIEPNSFVFDIDGDGTANLVVLQPGVGWVALFATGPFQQWGWRVVGTSVEPGLDPREFYFLLADVNGDGLRDIVGISDPNHGGKPSTSDSVWINLGGRLSRTQRFGSAGVPKYPGFVVDIDRDGVEEMLVPGADYEPWRIANFGNYIVSRYGLPAGPQYPGTIADFDGDGNVDVVSKNPTSGQYFLHRGRGKRHNLLLAVTDGLGRKTEISYDDKDASGNLVYGGRATRSTASCQWPVHCLPRNPGTPLVSSTRQSHFTDAAHTVSKADKLVTYSYSAAREDMAGLGWLGFDSRSVVEKDGTGQLIKQTEIYYREPFSTTAASPTLPGPAYAQERLLDGRPETINEKYPTTSSGIGAAGYLSTQTDLVWVVQTATGGMRFPVLKSKHTVASELSDRFSMPGLFERTEEFTVDGYGNIESTTVEAHDFSRVMTAQAPVPESRTRTSVATTFTPTQSEIDAWLISLPKTRVVQDEPRCPIPTGCPLATRTRTTTFTYEPGSNRVKTATRELGDATLELKTEFFRDSLGNVYKVVATPAIGEPRTTEVGYDDNGLFPVSTTNALNQTTQLQFDERFGEPTVRTDPNGIDETWAYDDFGELRFHHGPQGNRTIRYESASPHAGSSAATFQIEAAYRVVDEKSGGATVITEYNALGQPVERRSSGLKDSEVVEELGYDARDLLAVRTRPHLSDGSGEAQGVISYQYDAMRRPKRVDYTSDSHVTIDHAFADGLNTDGNSWRLAGATSFTRTTDPNGHTTVEVNDRDGQILGVIDALGQVTRYERGAFGAVTTIVPPSPSAPVLSYEYDAYGRMLSHTDAAWGGTETVTYNGFDEPVTRHDPLQRLTSITYDDLGRVERIVDPDGTSSWVYDGDGTRRNEIGRLVSAQSSTGQVTRYGYEPPAPFRNRGFLNQVTRVLTRPGIASTEPPRELTTGYRYDDYSRLKEIQYPAQGQPFNVDYHFDSAGHVVKATDETGVNVYWELTAAYHGLRAKTEKFGGGATTTERTYKPRTGQVTGIKTTAGSNVVQDLTYDYDLAGNMSLREDHRATTYEQFTYDELNRITDVRAQNGSSLRAYTYDSPEGRLKTQSGLGTYDYWPNGRDWLKTAGQEGRQFDGVGNVHLRTGPSVPGGTQTIEYTAFNLPSHVETGGGASPLVTDFAYDASAARVVKASTTGVTYYADELYRADEQAGAATSYQYQVFVGGRAVAVANSQDLGNGSASTPSLLYLHGDSLGSVQTVTRSDGTLEQGHRFDPFGSVQGGNAVDASLPLGFTAQEHDPELGLINMRGRMYDPAVGQFLSPDPIMQEPYGQGLNRYAYVKNSPLNYVDPSGFEWEDIANGLAIPGWGAAVVAGAYFSTHGISGSASALGSVAGSVGDVVGPVAQGLRALDDAKLVLDLFANHGDQQISLGAPRGARAAGAPAVSVSPDPLGGNPDGRSSVVHEGRRGFGQDLSDFLSEPPMPVPGEVDPNEPFADPYVRSEMRRAYEESHPSASPEESGTKEQGGWIVKRGGKYQVIRWDDTKPTTTNQRIDSDGPAPKGTVATFHTHPNLDPTRWRYSASELDWHSAWGDPYPTYIVSPNGVYRLANGSQTFLGPLGGGMGVVPWIALGVGVAGGTVAYCHFHGC